MIFFASKKYQFALTAPDNKFRYLKNILIRISVRCEMLCTIAIDLLDKSDYNYKVKNYVKSLFLNKRQAVFCHTVSETTGMMVKRI